MPLKRNGTIQIIILGLLVILMATGTNTLGFLTNTWRDIIVLATFSVLLISVGWPLVKRVLYQRHSWRPFFLDYGSHQYDRAYDSVLKDGEVYSKKCLVILDTSSNGTFLLRLRPHMMVRPRHSLQIGFSVDLVSSKGRFPRKWISTLGMSDGPKVNYIDGLRLAPESLPFRVSSWVRGHHDSLTLPYSRVEGSNTPAQAKFAFIRVGIQGSSAWSGYLEFKGSFEVEDWQWSFNTEHITHIVRMPIIITPSISGTVGSPTQ
jgi:hypothetical protein